MLLVALFLVSGFLGLVYEVVWIRKLALVFGSTNLAMSVVLAVFFGGLALGSVVFGRVAGRSGHLPRLYGGLEIGVSVWALAFPWLAAAGDRLYAAVASGRPSDAAAVLSARIAIGALLLLPPTTLMGGTLPVLSRYFVASRSQVGRRLGGLYAINTVGGALGVLFAGFVAMRHLGIDGTLYAAGSVNLLVGLLASSLPPGIAPASSDRAPPARSEDRTDLDAPTSRRVLALAAFAVAGFTGLGYEVVWSRYLALFVTNSIQATSTVLAVFLLGLVLGSLLFASLIDGRRRPLEILGLVQAGIGISALIMLPLLTRVSGDIDRAAGSLLLKQFALSALLMAVPTILAGATFPLVVRIAATRLDLLSRTVGALYAVNTIGAIAGSLAAGFWLVPRLGVSGANAVLAAINVGLGAVVLSATPDRGSAFRLGVAGAVVVAAIAAPTAFPERVPQTRLSQLAGAHERVIAVEEGLVNTVWISADAAGRRALWTDRSVMGRTSRPYRAELSPQRVQGHIPLLVHAGEPRRLLGIAFGTGQTLGAQLLHPIDRLEAVDISPTVVSMSLANFAQVQSGLGTDPRVRIVLDDGRSFVDRARETWDVVGMEMPPHQEAGIVHFYTVDFYRHLARRLAPDAVVAQWVPIYNVSPDEAASCARTFLDVFPNAVLWYNASDVLLLGFNGPFRLDPERIARRLAVPGVADDLDVSYLGDGSVRLREVAGVVAGLLLGPEELRRYAGEGKRYTDERPDLEFSWADFRVFGADRHARLVLANLDRIERFLGPIAPHLAPSALEPTRVEAIRRAYLQQVRAAAYANLAGIAADAKPELAMDLYRRALDVRPDFAEARAGLGAVLLRADRPAEALAAFALAVATDDTIAEAHFGLADAYLRLGREDDALAAYRDAIRVRPGYVKAHLAVGRILARRGDASGAEASYRLAVESAPIDADAHLVLARALFESGRAGEAADLLREAKTRFPDDRRITRALTRVERGPDRAP